MTGDGVNDAPALKKADVGIAVEGASEVARAAASMVLLAPGLGVVIDAIKTSRQVFNRMYGYAEYRLAISMHLVIYLTFSQLIFDAVLNLTLVVFLALFADVAVLTIAYDRAETSPDPVKWNLPKLMFRSFFISLCLMTGTIIIHTVALGTDVFDGDWEQAVFLELALTQNWMIFSTRTHAFAFYSFLPSPLLVIAVFLVDILASMFIGFGWFTTGVPFEIIVRVWLYSMCVFVITDILQRLLARWKWLDNFLTDRGKSAKKDKERRKYEDMAHQFQIMSQSARTEAAVWAAQIQAQAQAQAQEQMHQVQAQQEHHQHLQAVLPTVSVSTSTSTTALTPAVLPATGSSAGSLPKKKDEEKEKKAAEGAQEEEKEEKEEKEAEGAQEEGAE